MDLSCLRHQSDSRYCFSIDERHVLIRLAISKTVDAEDVQIIYGDPIGFSLNHKYLKLELKHTDSAFNYFEVIIYEELMRLMYVFYIKENGKDFYFSESGLSDRYIFDLAFISAFQYVGENYNDFVKEKESWSGRVMYQIFPERFFNSGIGDKSYVNTDWYSKELVIRRDAFLGGDLQGVIEKLDYLKELGIGAIYLTPIHPSDSNHKYDVKDFFDIDQRFGGKEVFFHLIEEAHERDIKIMMDLVFNHMASNNPIFLDVMEKGNESIYYDWFFINGVKPTKNPLNYRCFGKFAHMPKLNTNNKKVQDYLIKVGLYWAREFKVDGFRLDVSEGVSHDFWNRFKLALKEVDEDIILIGENWYNSESYLGNNQFDGVMNYPFLGVVSGYVTGLKDAEETKEAFDALLVRYKDGHNRQMMNILGSHDIQRFYHLCNKDKDLSLIGHSIMMFYLGYPLIYYGEEIFMDGAGDPDNRRGMNWMSPEFNSPEHRIMKDLIKLRSEKSLAKGDIEISEVNGMLKFKRIYQGSGYCLFTNLTESNKRIEGNVILSNHYINKEIEPGGFAITKVFE